ncbi:UDP-glucose/GDP-mannose dehydrogenase family protein [Pelagibius sp. 7325]|uniref:UDP-glucose dehydrogenase family protein n=1 Tax=Pelagibius sp. 7325 TaxID=3131994 RepID=UPI0030EB4FFF
MRIAVVGTGYVGLVSGACLAELGFETWCIDKDGQKIEGLKQGIMPIFEANLEDVVVSNHEGGRLHFTTSMVEAIPEADVVILAVGTPDNPDGSVNLEAVFAAGRLVAEHLQGSTVVVTKSTVPVGTSRALYKAMRAVNPDADFETASNPEFLREGEAVKDFMCPDRIVIGVASPRSAAVLQRLYRPQQLAGVPLEIADPETAELTKYACNSFLATKVAFINDVADLCEAVGADVRQVGRGMGLDTRIGPKFLQPGPGYGGSCFPKDTKAFVRMGEACGRPQRIVEAVVEANGARKRNLIHAVRRACGGSLADKRIAVLGLAFKPDTDDVRESPALDLVPALVQAGAEVRAHDPCAIEMAKSALEGTTLAYCSDVWTCLEDADAVVLLTHWQDYLTLQWGKVAATMRGKTLVDFRNVLDPVAVTGSGLEYNCIGAGPLPAADPARQAIAAAE